ncbi:MAG: DUF4159 domain-containing protein [Tepidisphaeraceae bacterium]
MIRAIGVVVVVAVLAVASSAHAATSQQVSAAIEKSKTWLYAQQSKDHTWEQDFASHGEQKTGQTALAVYALLSAGESHQDPRLAPAIEYLKKTPTTGVYALGLRCQVWLALPQTPAVKQAMSADAKVLVASVQRGGDARGFYDYNPAGRKSIYSHSRGQYGVLGLWAAAQAGVAVPRDHWQLIESAWISHQDASGGWAYYVKPREAYPVTPGMTAAGVATLFITQDFLHAGDGLAGVGNVRNPAIERGMKWMAENFSRVATKESYARDYPFATLYAVERIGVASGIKYFGDVDWYEKGADFLVDQQKSDGSFASDHGSKVATTCFATLFLSRGAYPVFMNKLDFAKAGVAGKDANWNQRPRDVANAARWTGRQIERDLNWQIVTLDSPVKDWHDAPILYIAGGQALNFTPEHEAKLKQFIEQGGLVLANADNASAGFASGFQALGKKLFPSYPFAPLPEGHVIYTGEQFARSKWQRKPQVLSMSNGPRELMVLLPDADAGRAWQLNNPALREELYQLAANIFLYAVDKQNLRRRGESFLVKADEKISPTKAIKLARIEYAGNWNPEPGGWRRLAAMMRNQDKVDLAIEPVKLAAGALKDHKIANLTGTAAFTLDAAAREELKRFAAAGGTIVLDAAGGSSAFASAAEKELAVIWPDAKAQWAEPIPADAELFQGVKTIGYRTYARAKLGQLKSPRLRGIKAGNQFVVIYSAEDLSVGLVGQPVDGIVGYDPETATALMRRIVLSSAPSQEKPTR